MRTWCFVSILLTTVQMLRDVSCACGMQRLAVSKTLARWRTYRIRRRWCLVNTPAPSIPTSPSGSSFFLVSFVTDSKLETWVNAQRDGRPAEYRWHPLFNAAKFGWRPLLECRAVTQRSRETSWNLQACPKLANRFQPLMGRSSPCCEDMWGRHCYLTFFYDCRYMP